jgi:beta-N-acetylhexosaminidase
MTQAAPTAHRAASTPAASRRARTCLSIPRARVRRWPARWSALLALALFVVACGHPSPAARAVATPHRLSPQMLNTRQSRSAYQAPAAWKWIAARQRLQQATIDWYLAHLSLDDQLGQLLLDGCSCGGGPTGPVYSGDLAAMVTQQHIGGLILFGNNYGSMAQTQQVLQEVQAHASIPLLVGTDQEGGPISRVDQYFGPFPSERDLATAGNPQVIYTDGRQTALDLQQVGINVDFAPVVDVPVQGGGYWGPFRTYSSDPQVVADDASQYIAGLHSAGEIAVLKHYPGIGSVTADPHASLPVVMRSLDQMQQSELVPYRALIPQQPDMIMATDVVVPAVDASYPAEMSPVWITTMLRQQLGYDGVVITDSLWMAGVAAHWDLATAAVQAIVAGDDVVMAAYDAASTQRVLNAFKQALATGRLTPERIAQSVRRVLTLKLAHGLLPIPPEVVAAQPSLNSIFTP